MIKDRHILEDWANVMTYERAKIEFARKGKIFNLINHTLTDFDPYDTEARKEFIRKMTSQRSDFWIYETDNSIGSAVSPVHVNYEPTYADSIDINTVSPARLRYLERRAEKKHLTLVDYAAGKRKIVSWQCTLQYSGVRFNPHCLERYWQRSQMCNGTNTFKDFPKDTIKWLCGYALTLSEQQYKLRRQYIPYEDGVFVAEIVMNPTPIVTTNDKGERKTLQGYDHGANCITFLHSDDLNGFQRLMVKAIHTRNKQEYEKLLADDNMASYKLWS